MSKIGIMQGRLSPPQGGKIQSFPKKTWKEEFKKAKSAQLSGIEWIFEADDWEQNPISSEEGLREIKEIISETGIEVESVCADYFIDIPYFRSSMRTQKELKEILEWVVSRVYNIGAKYINLPFIDASIIEDPSEFLAVKEFISPALKTCLKLGVTIALETSLNSSNFKDLLLSFNHPHLMANYDLGNSAAAGYNCQEELASYGRWIKTVHVKDRTLDGGTVPLGAGNAGFDIFFRELLKLNFDGPIILQAAREGDELETAIKNRRFVQNLLEKYSL